MECPQSSQNRQIPPAGWVANVSGPLPGRRAKAWPTPRARAGPPASTREETRLASGPCAQSASLRVAAKLAFFVLSNRVNGLVVSLVAGVAGETVLHEKGVLPAVFVVGPQDARRPKTLGAEKQLSRKVRFTNHQSNTRPAMAGQLADELGDHLGAHPDAPATGMNGEVQNIDLQFIQLINHQAP